MLHPLIASNIYLSLVIVSHTSVWSAVLPALKLSGVFVVEMTKLLLTITVFGLTSISCTGAAGPFCNSIFWPRGMKVVDVSCRRLLFLQVSSVMLSSW